MNGHSVQDGEPSPRAEDRPLPGARLREARERRRMTVGDIANKLNLDEQFIRTLEADDYTKLPAPIFVSGYLRGYARLVDLPAEPLVAAYEQMGPEAPRIVSGIAAVRPVRRRRSGLWLICLLLAGLLLVPVVWWVFRSEPHLPQQEPPARKEEASRQSAAVTQAIPSTQPKDVRPRLPAVPRDSDASGSVRGPEQAVQDPHHQHASSVVLHFSSDSWVEVADATGKRLFFDLGKAGQTHSLKGEAPFSLLLGYSPGVSIEYNGKPFDQSPYNRNDMARFKLGSRNN